jgi:transcription antitermination factor NusG
LTSRWHVLCCKPHKEQVILRQLQHMGYEAYFPCFISPSNKMGSFELRPYFPGYLFVKVDLKMVGLSTFQWMPNTEGLVCFESKPAFVPDPLVRAVRRHVDQLNLIQVSRSQGGDGNWEQLAEPESENAGYDGLFDRSLTSAERINSLLHLLEGLSLPPASGEA